MNSLLGESKYNPWSADKDGIIYDEDDFLMLSGIQHFYFCKRQWALIHIEQQWSENVATTEGNILHEKADNAFLKEKRNELLISRAVPLSSRRLGLSGIADVIEFRKSDQGIVLNGKKGYWNPTVVEYKKGKEKSDERDIVQLAAQVMCAEEKWAIHIDTAYLYYFQTNKRIEVFIDNDIREKVVFMAKEMHSIYERRYTPEASFFKNCTLCSLYDICMPRLTKKKVSVYNYMYEVDE